MKLIIDGNKYVLISTYEARAIPKAAGFRWSPADRHWWTADLDTALAVADDAEISPEADAALDEAVESQRESLTASSAQAADIDVPAPDGLAYLPFQRAGIAYAMDRKAVLIADEMGLGTRRSPL